MSSSRKARPTWVRRWQSTFPPTFGVSQKRLHVQSAKPATIQPHPLLHQGQRHPPRRRLPTPPIKQSVIAELFVTFAPAPHVPVADADDLRCLPPRDLLRHGPQNHFLYFH